MQKETRSIENFRKINFKDFGTLILIQGDAPALTIEADKEVLTELISEVHNDTLTLGLPGDWFSRLGKAISSLLSSTDRKITYTLTAVDLDKISVSGQCKLTCETFKTDDLTINVSGLGHLAFSQLDCNALIVSISGRGEFSAAGRADEQTVKISGSADYDAPNLASKNVKIVISGQGNANLNVEENLDITISGMGQVNYHGRPKLRQVISGLGKSKRLSDN